MTVGKRIKQRRKELGMTATDLGFKIGRNRATVYKYENGSIENLPYTVIFDLSKALNTTPEFLTGLTDDPVDYEEWLNDSGHIVPDEFYPELDDYDRAKKFYEFKQAELEDGLNYHGMSPYEESNISAANKFMFSQTIQIPVYGSVPAGVPIEAIQDIDGYVDIPADWADHGRYMALTVHGSSMYPKYLDGDTVVIKIQDYIPSGQDGVVYVNGYDATLKTVINEVDGSTTLKPVNPEYETKNYKPGIVKPLGLVKRMIREL